MSALNLQREVLEEQFAKAKKEYDEKQINDARFKEISESYKQADLYLKKNGE